MNLRRIRTRGTDGFVLVMTVALLGLLLLVLLALGALERIEDGLATQAQNRGRARQQTLVALDLAVAQLQSAAGPDGRATAASAADTLHPHYAGVWDAAVDGAAPLTWLVSGNDGSAPLAVTPATPFAGGITLVGAATAGRPDDVVVPMEAVVTDLLPGTPGGITLGHYAWWTGDEGLKAPLASALAGGSAAYAPYDSAEARRRLRQQAGAGPAAPEFDAAAEANAAALPSVLVAGQLASLAGTDGTALGAETVRARFHAWSADNLAVLADAKAGGLRRDLSLRPELLGAAFAAWADYSRSLEAPAAVFAPAPLPAFGIDPVRRRHRLTPPLAAGGLSHAVRPLLTYFLLSFNVRTQGGSSGTKPLEVRARWMATFWNPYTGALVPENLKLEVDGLVPVRVVDETLGVTVATLGLNAVDGAPLRIALPWDDGSSTAPDRRSWLPGRVYTWSSLEDTSGIVPAGGYASAFYTRNLSASGGQGVQHRGGDPVDGGDLCHLAIAGPQTLTLRLSVARAGGDALLATFTSPTFAGFATTARKLSAGTYQFSYLFRLAESADTPLAPGAWLTAPGAGLQSDAPGPGIFVTGANGNRPELYENEVTISAPDRLFDRAGGNLSYNEDAPLFELPRAPLLSLGQLQHAPLLGSRPFAIGNPWGAAVSVNGIPANALFDRFYFSGRSDPAPPPDGAPWPNSGLRLLPRRADGALLDAADVVAADGTSKFLLQSGAFNVNSGEREAWIAVLRAVRFSTAAPFSFLDASLATGTAGDVLASAGAPADAHFFRFAQSAQETWKADDPRGGVTYAASANAPPAAPDTPSNANTFLFRRGMRTLDGPTVAALADAIVSRMDRRQAASGPWRSLEELLDPSALFPDARGNPQSLLQDAIASTGINAAVAEFSSQWLTQGDLMTALAPVLFTRSDTFVIRCYGDACNPATGAIEARAWAEARVQRLPEYVDPADPPETPPGALGPVNARLGRRFKIVSFRWMSPGEI